MWKEILLVVIGILEALWLLKLDKFTIQKYKKYTGGFMERLLKRIFFIFIMFLSINVVKAEQFKIGEYIDGEYVKMVSSDTSKYLTIQIIRDSNSNFVYCIEPFVLVDEN